MPYIPHTEAELKEMLQCLDVSSLDELFSEIPQDMRPTSFKLEDGKSEYEVASYFNELASMNNKDLISFLGAGYYDHAIPEAVNTLSSRGEFVTAYTPYQPEVSQGTLQGIFEFQSAVARLTELDISNASVYDAGTALFEAVMMSCREAKGKKKRIVIDSAVSPIWRVMLDTHTANLDIEIVEIEQKEGVTQIESLKKAIDENTASVLVQNPNFFGNVYDFTDLFKYAHEKGALAIIAIQPMMQSLIKTPGEMDADIAVADGQSLGLPLSFGGPYSGLITCKKAYVRQMPGRIVGRTQDLDGKVGYVLTVQAREQHIRRSKATSNICSNQALCAMRNLMYMATVGSEGMERTALLSMENTRYAVGELAKIGNVSILSSDSPYAYEVAIKLPISAKEFINKLLDKGFVAGFPIGKYYKDMENVLLFACTEKRTKKEIDSFVAAAKAVLK